MVFCPTPKMPFGKMDKPNNITANNSYNIMYVVGISKCVRNVRIYLINTKYYLGYL